MPPPPVPDEPRQAAVAPASTPPAVSHGAEVRFATRDDVEPVCRLLVETFPRTSIPFWRQMLNSPWLAAEDKPDFGVVLTVKGEVCGYQGSMYSDRVVGDRVARFCNGFGWCVRPEHRRYSVALLRPLGTRPGLTFTNLTQRSDLIPLFLKMGYELADERKYVSYPRVGALLARGADRVRLIPTEEVTESLLGRDAYRVHQDHIGRTVRRMVFEAGGEACLVVTKRVYEAGMRLGRSELFYASDKAFLERHFEQVKLGILRQDKTAGLHADARLLGFVPKGASWIPGTALFKSPSVSAEHIDALYSELVFLE